jgi:hypothetical protein
MNKRLVNDNFKSDVFFIITTALVGLIFSYFLGNWKGIICYNIGIFVCAYLFVDMKKEEIRYLKTILEKITLLEKNITSLQERIDQNTLYNKVPNYDYLESKVHELEKNFINNQYDPALTRILGLEQHNNLIYSRIKELENRLNNMQRSFEEHHHDTE